MLPTSPINAASATASNVTPQPNMELTDESKMRFEQLLWAELLTHTGLEDALTLGGGDGASMFARYFVEAIAEDIAKQHPLGLLDKELPTEPAAVATKEMKDHG